MTKAIHIHVPDAVISILDEQAEKIGITRSGLIKIYLFEGLENVKQ